MKILRALHNRPYVSMQSKLFVALTAASLILFSGLLFFSLNGFKDAFYDQKTDDMTLYTERTGQFLDMYFQNVRNILLEAARTLGEDELRRPDEAEAVLSRVLELNREFISQIYVLTEDGRILTGDRLLYDIIEHPQLMEAFRIVEDNPGLIGWSQPYYSPMLVDDTVAFALGIADPSGRRIGTVLAEIDTPRLSAQLSKLLNVQEKSYVLFSDQGNIIDYDRNSSLLPYRKGTVPKRLTESFERELWAIGNGVNRVTGASDTLLTIKSNRNQLGWYLVTLTGERSFWESAQLVIQRFIVVSALWFVLLSVFTYLISRHFVRPVKRLALQMVRFNGESFAMPESDQRRNDEIGDLTRSYRRLIERIRALLETVREKESKKKEIELKLLLSQIRPHFLYNTLSCIGSLAKQHRVQEVEETIRSLIVILTFSIDKKTELVSLEEELDTLRAYVQILKVRYGDTFRFEVDVPAAHLDYAVPKMLLQPLVENALFHGLATNEAGVIAIASRRVGDELVLTVADNGIGMTESKLRSILDGSGGERRSRRGGLNGIGLTNIDERLKLSYGEEYGLRIRSAPGEGTVVELALPCEP
ncbi:sensor histidine kinase [Paenibacillus sp.]|uniref:cache domain-containing sensor histidine kinase n=1 Tax=Paenibacillus sp. TaxID=58172 RepID=UPI002D3CA556|nr:sensor histidine kinase [Paenibacillus sp.]HZG55256.1 sensor histidine kinase [Paenibacillus sp.]